MKKKSLKASFYIDLVIIVSMFSFMSAVIIAYEAGYRINRTNSLPIGFYRVIDKQPERNDIVSFWPDGSEPFRIARERRYIIPGKYLNRGDGGYDALMKKLMGLPGDVVSITDSGVFINGELIPNTLPLECDNIGDPLPSFRLHDYTLRENEVLLVSDYLPRSYDARYFGIQDKGQILDVLVPVYTW